MTEEQLKAMKVGDVLFDERIGHIHRVVGGWVYQFVSGGVFVPYLEQGKISFAESIRVKDGEEKGQTKAVQKKMVKK